MAFAYPDNRPLRAATPLPLAASLALLLLAGCSGQQLHKTQVGALAPAPATPPATGTTAEVTPNKATATPGQTAEDTAATSPSPATSAPASNPPPMATAEPAVKTGAASDTTQTEDKDMTVLVLDNPKLLEQAAQLQTPDAQAVPPTTDSIRQPEKTQFHYAFDAHRLSDADRAILEDHGRYLAAHPDLRVKVIGHSDSQGPSDYNLFLSRLRAADAAKILEKAGASPDQIDIEGVGSSQPLSQAGDYAANRRLEVKYLNPALARSR